MYKKITKIKKVTKTYASPDEEKADMSLYPDEVEETVNTKTYGDNVCMDLPFFVKMLEHVHMKITTPAELQVFADAIVSAAKEYPVLTGEWFEKLI